MRKLLNLFPRAILVFVFFYSFSFVRRAHRVVFALRVCFFANIYAHDPHVFNTPPHVVCQTKYFLESFFCVLLFFLARRAYAVFILTRAKKVAAFFLRFNNGRRRLLSRKRIRCYDGLLEQRRAL